MRPLRSPGRASCLMGTRKVDDPVHVVEVMSPSTMADDRGYKFTRYVTIPALRRTLFVYPEEARVESWTRGEQEWALEVIQGLDAAVPILSLGEASPTVILYAGE